ncbi:MAG: hypothetical protein IPG94_04900 [Kineosporiaceae bacterium]|nr:hypothetical protein [Kineosporiaceae bacterium]
METTGLSPRSDRIVEIAILTTDTNGRVLEEWSTRVNPGRPMGATCIHGLTDADVQTAPTFDAVAGTVAALLSTRAMVAHNAPFDSGFLQAEFERAGWSWPQTPTLCTLEASHYYLPFLERRRLADCCYVCGIGLFDEHSALGDARAVAQLLSLYLYPAWGRTPLSEHLRLPEQALRAPALEQSVSPWPHLGDHDAAPVRGRRARVTKPHGFRTLGPLLSDLAIGEFAGTDARPDRSAHAYLELLAEALEDGDLSSSELEGLGDLASRYQLTLSDVLALHNRFVHALADKAVEDQFVSKAERLDLTAVALLLELDPTIVDDCLQRAEHSRQEMLNAGCRPLPDGWHHGDPLRLGDRIAFTGCDPNQRADLEQASTRAGLRLTGSVSRKTSALVTDGSCDGNKAEAARVLGTRIIHPDDLQYLLDFVQPASTAPSRKAPPPRPAAPASLGIVMAPIDPIAVRAWARSQGTITGSRGRLSRDLVEAYLHASTSDGRVLHG